jgi:hypothetical protein
MAGEVRFNYSTGISASTQETLSPILIQQERLVKNLEGTTLFFANLVSWNGLVFSTCCKMSFYSLQYDG